MDHKPAGDRKPAGIAHNAGVGLLMLFAASFDSALAAGGRIVIADPFGPTAGWALETDDAFVLTKVGCLEALARVDFDGNLVPALGRELAAGLSDRVGRHDTRRGGVPER